MSFRKGRRIGVDLGSVRIGVAICDPDGILAVPERTIPASDDDVDHVADLAQELDVMEIVVGNPRALSGESGPAEQRVREWAKQLTLRVDIPIRLVDERMSSVIAGKAMRASGLDARAQRPHIDQAAAVVILQDALDTERATGIPPGEVMPRD